MPFIITASDNFDAASEFASKVWETLTSENAQKFYQFCFQVVKAIVLFVALVVAVVFLAARKALREYGKPGALVVYAYAQDKAIQARREFRPWLGRCQLALEREWQSLVALALMRWQGLF